MTYIKVNATFFELEALSQLVNLPKSTIEEIVDKGYISSDENSWIADGVLETVKKLKLIVCLSELSVDNSVTEEIVSTEAVNHGELFETLFQENKISKRQLSRLRRIGRA